MVLVLNPGETFMDSIAIVYFSATGHTHLMAEAIAAGGSSSW